MKPSELQPSMPSIKFWLHIILFAIALFLLYILLQGRLIDNERKVAIFVSVMVTLFIISLVELIPEILRWMTEWRKQNKFKRFFGTAAFKDKVRLVFAHRVLDSYLGQDPWHTHYKQYKQGNFVPEGVNAWLAFQDVRAAVYLSNEIYSVTGDQVKFIHDKDIEEDDFEFCAISVGLGFNCFTHHLAGLCDGKLFKIEWGKSPKQNFQTETDLFSINGICPDPPEGKDYCIVARIVSRSAPNCPKRVCFVCAGRTAAGTAAAGFFLANDWTKLMKLYKSNKKILNHDSMVVVVKHTTDESGMQVFDSTGEIAVEQDKPFVNWAIASGVD